MKYYQIIKELRIDRDMTQSQTAKILGVSQEYYCRYELGKIPLPIKHLEKLCLFFGVSADYVLGLPKGLKWLR